MIDANESNFYKRKILMTVNFPRGELRAVSFTCGEIYLRRVLPAESFIIGELYKRRGLHSVGFNSISFSSVSLNSTSSCRRVVDRKKIILTVLKFPSYHVRSRTH